jgi:uncharacterized protein YndB with AHSA1/START domain
MTESVPGAPRLLGTLRAAGGAGVVRVEDHLDAGIDDLWSALTDRRRLAVWLGEVEGDLQLGGAFHARFYASGSEGSGRVQVCEPPRHFVVTRTTTEDLVLTIEATLRADGDRTVLTVEERGMPLGLLSAYGAGVQIHVEDLADYVAGRERRDEDARWDELIAAYSALDDRAG